MNYNAPKASGNDAELTLFAAALPHRCIDNAGTDDLANVIGSVGNRCDTRPVLDADEVSSGVEETHMFLFPLYGLRN
jgi:hypothetical protein